MLKYESVPVAMADSARDVGVATEREPSVSGEETAIEPIPLRRSLLRYSPALVLVIIAIADSGRFADPDLWGHVYSGEYVLRHGHFLMRDPFSYSAAGHLWRDHERLSAVVFAWAYVTGGMIGLKLLKFICTAAVILLISLA